MANTFNNLKIGKGVLHGIKIEGPIDLTLNNAEINSSETGIQSDGVGNMEGTDVNITRAKHAIIITNKDNQEVTFRQIDQVFDYLGLDRSKVDTEEFKNAIKILQSAENEAEDINNVAETLAKNSVFSSSILDKTTLLANIISIGGAAKDILNVFLV